MYRGGWRTVLVAGAWVWCAWAVAHPRLSEYVQHDITLEAGGTYVDVDVRLTFFDLHALDQEAALDADGDGRYSAAEREAYGAAVLSAAESQLGLYLGDEELPLIALYEPEIRVHAPETGSHGHRRFEVRLPYFARLPATAPAGEALEVRDGLFPALPALAAFRVRGTDGVRLRAVDGGRGLAREPDAATPLVLRATLKPAPASDAIDVPNGENPGDAL